MNARPNAPRAYSRLPVSDAIEWEELPSLAATLGKRLTTRGAWRGAAAPAPSFEESLARNSVWDATMPAQLDVAPVSAPLRETLDGLATREVLEPDVFRIFFGDQAA